MTNACLRDLGEAFESVLPFRHGGALQQPINLSARPFRLHANSNTNQRHWSPPAPSPPRFDFPSATAALCSSQSTCIQNPINLH